MGLKWLIIVPYAGILHRSSVLQLRLRVCECCWPHQEDCGGGVDDPGDKCRQCRRTQIFPSHGRSKLRE